MKKVLNKIPQLFKNFYVLSISFFLLWLTFFDSNDLLTQVKLSAKEAELKKTKFFYEEKIEKVQADREALLTNDDQLEKLAREKYFMKKDKEEVFIVVEE